jgi:N-acetylglucosaminyldiphosphoundecaprenol N-acetyl-beta-D-mannosaminyltransferase
MERVSLMGLGFDPVTEAQAVDAVMEGVARDDGGWVVTPTLEYLREYQLADDVRTAFDEADLVVPDGAPLLWASQLKRDPLPGRVAGSDLIWSLSRAAAERRASVYLVGGSPGSAERAAARLERECPGLLVRGTACPQRGFDRNGAAVREIAAAVAEARPDIVYIGLPLRKHLTLAHSLRERLPQSWLVGVGVSFSFVAGDIQRAPRWVQRVGLEWMHRLAQEPRRLFRRYVLEGIPFAARLMAYAGLTRLLSRLALRPDRIEPRRSP